MEIEVAGLDGADPLGFLASLGLLRLLDERSRQAGHLPPRMAWSASLGPLLTTSIVATIDDLVALVASDSEEWSQSAVLTFAYLKREKKGLKPFQGLAPQLAVLRGWLTGRLTAGDVRALDYMTALVTETAAETGDDLPSAEELLQSGVAFDPETALDSVALRTSLDFTSRNTQFLDQISVVRAELDAAVVANELQRGAANVAATRTMGWGSGADAPGALFSKRANLLYPASEWLAFRGLVSLPVFGAGSAARTTACRGRRKAGSLVWSLWDGALGFRTVKSLLALPEPEHLGAAQRRARGIRNVFAARLTKGADGYSGVFAPTAAV